MAESIILKGALGINNKIDPLRHPYNPETGVGFLAEAINCDIDDSGMLSRRSGRISISANASHSLFCSGNYCFVVQDRTSDSVIYQIGTNFALTSRVTGLTKAAKVSFWQVGEKTFYMNGFQKGVLVSGIAGTFPGYTHVGVQSVAEYYPAPIGTHICVFKGRMWVAQDNVIWVSEPFAFGKYRISARFFQFSTNVLMMMPVENGVWVSDSTKTGFIRFEDKFENMKFEKKLDMPAHEWSQCASLKSFTKSPYKIPGLSAIWSCDEGLMVGDEVGNIHNFTEDKMYYPNGTSGASVIFEDIIINSVY